MIANGKPESPHSYEPHLLMREFSVPPGREWASPLNGWVLVQIGEGAGYWIQGQSRTELAAGSLLLIANPAAGRILSSQLGVMILHAFSLMTERLNGLMTLGEQNLFKQAASRIQPAFRIFPPENSLATRMKDIRSHARRNGLLRKLSLLQILVEALGDEFEEQAAGLEIIDAKERLRKFLAQMPPNALLEISFDKLAQMAGCTPRHLSRIFYDVVGMSFRDKRAEIRLARARELLATSQTKVVEVALESGYKSVSLFNLMFTRRFGISPGKWRQKNGAPGETGAARRNNPPKLPANKSRRLTI